MKIINHAILFFLLIVVFAFLSLCVESLYQKPVPSLLNWAICFSISGYVVTSYFKKNENN